MTINKVPSVVTATAADFAVLEERNADGKWRTVAFIGPERSGGYVEPTTIGSKKVSLRIRYLKYAESFTVYAETIQWAMTQQERDLCSCRKNGIGYNGHKKRCDVHAHRKAFKALRRLLVLLRWWAQFSNR